MCIGTDYYLKVVRLGTCHFFVLWSSYWAEAGRDHEKLIILAKPYTPYVEPEVPAVVAGIQATTIVAQAVLIGATARSRGPPVAVASIIERAIVVAPASNRRKSGYVASASNTIKSTASWQSPAFRADIVSGIISTRSLTVCSSRCCTEVIPVTCSSVAGVMDSAVGIRAATS